MVWRCVVDPHIRASLIEVQTEWSIDDVLDAQFIANAFAEAENES